MNGNDESPYLKARGVWNERNRDLLTGKRNWQRLAAIALGSNAILGLGILWLAAQSQVVPYVVRVDEAGQALVVGAASESSVEDPAILGWQLQNFVRDARHVTADGAAQKEILRSLYDRVAGPATELLNRHYRDHDPFVAAQERTVVPSIRNTLAVGDRSWQVEWTELHRSLDGKPLREETWTGRFEVSTEPPETPEGLLRNPLGFHVTSFSWSQKFAPRGGAS